MGRDLSIYQGNSSRSLSLLQLMSFLNSGLQEAPLTQTERMCVPFLSYLVDLSLFRVQLSGMEYHFSSNDKKKTNSLICAFKIRGKGAGEMAQS